MDLLGIAVGMATNIPPHNISECIAASLFLLENPEADVYQIVQHITAPDFPTGGIIIGRSGIINAYKTGHGSITMRAKSDIEVDKSGKTAIIVTELPYQVNKALLIEKIAELCKDGKMTGISTLRDESDKDGMRIVIEIKRGEIAEILLNKLYVHSNLQKNFSLNMVALVDGKPQILTLKQLLEAFLDHRRDIITKRSIYLLRKARERAHILEGLSVAIANIDKIISIVRNSKTPEIAKQNLLQEKWQTDKMIAILERAEVDIPDFAKNDYYQLSEIQASAILDLRLHRLTGLEYEKLCDEYLVKLKDITEFMSILTDGAKLQMYIKTELEEVLKQFGDERKTQISDEEIDLSDENLISREDRVITVSNHGYVKAQSIEEYRAQRRGGVGKSATGIKEEDWVEKLVVANTHDTVLCFSNRGKVYWLRAFEIPVASRQSRGRPMLNLLPLDEEEKITNFLPVKTFDEDKYIVMATAKGVTKKMSVQQFAKRRSSGLIAMSLRDDDYLVGSLLIEKGDDVMLFSDNGRAVRFHSDKLRELSRQAIGVRGMNLASSDRIVSLIIPQRDGDILTISENGYGKRTNNSEYVVKGRGGKGIISMKQSERNGRVVSAVQVFNGDEVMCISNGGTLVRTKVDGIAQVSRNTQGVRILKLRKNEKLIALSRIEFSEDVELAEVEKSE